tara:strand:- start:265 stop:645 length:381 start_codon:yes stop_codon:yes gene_type:complete
MAIKTTKFDKVFSDYIRYRDKWTCKRCGTKYTPPTASLHCSHFISRRYWNLRLEPINAMALCFGCHLFVGSNPIEHTKLWENNFTPKERAKLKKIYQGPVVQKKYIATEEKYQELKQMLNEVKNNG